MKYDQPAVRELALSKLRELGEHDEAKRLEGKLVPESERRRPRRDHPLELVVGVERLLEEGRPDAARLRLDEALARYPDDPDLLALRARLAVPVASQPDG